MVMATLMGLLGSLGCNFMCRVFAVTTATLVVSLEGLFASVSSYNVVVCSILNALAGAFVPEDSWTHGFIGAFVVVFELLGHNEQNASRESIATLPVLLLWQSTAAGSSTRSRELITGS